MQLSTARLAPLDVPQRLLTPIAIATQNNLINGKLVETHAGNAATFAVKTLAGNDPSASDPVMCIFPDASVLTITAALSLTLPTGFIPGTMNVNARPFRLWFALINDAGTARIGAISFVNSALVALGGFDPRGVTNAQIADVNVFYNQIGTTAAVSAKPYRAIAFADYESGLPTAGQFSVSPTRIVMVGPNTPMPGTVIQTQSFVCNAYTNCNSGGWVATNITQIITPTSPINAIQVECYSDHHFNAAATADNLLAQMFRNDNTGLPVGATQQDYTWSYTTIWGMIMYAQKFLDFPFTAAQTRYRLYGHLINSSGNYYYLPWTGATITLQELMA